MKKVKMLQHIRDYLELNVPNAIVIGALTLGELQTLAAIALSVVSIICTVALTVHKIKNRKE